MAKNKAHRDLTSPPRSADQDERIEQGLSDFVEALLAGAAYFEVRQIVDGKGTGWAVRLRKD